MVTIFQGVAMKLSALYRLYRSIFLTDFFPDATSSHPRKKNPPPNKLTERMATHHMLNTNTASTSKANVLMDLM